MGYLVCYCSRQIKKFGFGIVNEVFSTSKRKLCSEWLHSYESANGFTIGIVFLIIVSNVVIGYFVGSMGEFERSHTASKALASGTLKIFVAQFVNSVVPMQP